MLHKNNLKTYAKSLDKNYKRWYYTVKMKRKELLRMIVKDYECEMQLINELKDAKLSWKTIGKMLRLYAMEVR